MPSTRPLIAYVVPFAVFLGFLALVSLLRTVGGGFWLASPQYWVFPLQTVVCGGLVIWWRREYALGSVAQPLFTIAIGVLVFLLWIAPQQFLGYAPRLEGFNPTIFSDQPAAYWPTVLMRFLRLVVVVPLVEEIFWRGFLLRYLINEDFTKVPIGKFSWMSFLVVSIAFALTHAQADWPAAILTGMLYNFVAYRTKSLTSCVLVHAVTNLLLGLWIMRTGQWGFW